MTLEELRSKLRRLNELHNLRDAVYDVRQTAAEKVAPFDGSSWDLPDVVEYGALVAELMAFVNSHPSCQHAWVVIAAEREVDGLPPSVRVACSRCGAGADYKLEIPF